MTQPPAVDEYFSSLFVGDDPVLEGALRASREAGLPDIAVSAPQGKLLQLLALSVRARRILEVGTLGGYSAICLARGLSTGGRLISCEIDERHAVTARANLEAAGLNEVSEVRLGPALDTLRGLVAEGGEPFDLVFIDADKANNANYVHLALDLVRPGSIIIVDNVVRSGRVLESDSTDANVVGTRAVLELMASEPRLTATALQMVGSKGWDGFAIGLVTT